MKAKGYEHFWGIGRHSLGSQVFDYWGDPWNRVHEHWADTDVLNASVPPGLWGRGELNGPWGEPIPAQLHGPRGHGKPTPPLLRSRSARDGCTMKEPPMKTFVRCGQLFTGEEDEAQSRMPRSSMTTTAESSMPGPRRARRSGGQDDRLIDHSGQFVMPGLIDVHTHLAYGNAKTEEDIDLYSPLEFRALRGMFFAQKVLAAGYTAICSPGDAGQISLSIRNAIDAGLFDGPRVMAAGPYITSHQGLTDWYPTWIGAPTTSIGRLVTTVAEAVEEIRWQVKNGVDCVKIAMDGIQRRPDGELIAAFTQEETDIMVREIHRQGRKAVAHAVGREATLYSARAGVDLIFHGFGSDDECIAAMLKSGSTLCPTLTQPKNVIEFTQPHEPAGQQRPARGDRSGATRPAAPT